MKEAQIVPVFLGSAPQDHGVRRLWKALRHETPGAAGDRRRGSASPPRASRWRRSFKTYHLPHTGKLSLARVWRGTVSEGMVLNGTRVAGVLRVTGRPARKARFRRKRARSSA